MRFVTKSNTANTIAANNNACAITDSNRVFCCICVFTKCNRIIFYASISAA